MMTAVLVPILFVSAPILHAYAVNWYQMQPAELFAPSVFLLAAVLLLFCLLKLILRDTAVTSVLVSVITALFFAYGPLVAVIPVPDGVSVGPFVLGMYLIVLIALALLLRVRSRRRQLFKLVASIGIGLQIVPLATIMTQFADHGHFRHWTAHPVPTNAPGLLPDVYDIIVDAYAGETVLRELYGFDNRQFLKALSDRGFLIAGDSHSNYAQTHLSLASSLNMQYLDNLLGGGHEDSSSRIPLLHMIANNRAAATFRSCGYRYVTFSTGYLDNSLGRSDLYLRGPTPITQVWALLIGSTPIAVFHQFQYNMYRNRIRYVFEKLGNIPRDGHPLFVVAHVSVPHHPFVFAEDGSPINPNRPFSFSDDLSYYQKIPEARREYASSYARQLGFVNTELDLAIDTILADHARPAVIIIQGDHGPSLDWNNPERVNYVERFSILSAILLPGSQAPIDPAISPVNYFRVVASRYLGSDLPLLPNRSYYSSWVRPYAILDVTDKVRK